MHMEEQPWFHAWAEHPPQTTTLNCKSCGFLGRLLAARLKRVGVAVISMQPGLCAVQASRVVVEYL